MPFGFSVGEEMFRKLISARLGAPVSIIAGVLNCGSLVLAWFGEKARPAFLKRNRETSSEAQQALASGTKLYQALIGDSRILVLQFDAATKSTSSGSNASQPAANSRPGLGRAGATVGAFQTNVLLRNLMNLEYLWSLLLAPAGVIEYLSPYEIIHFSRSNKSMHRTFSSCWCSCLIQPGYPVGDIEEEPGDHEPIEYVSFSCMMRTAPWLRSVGFVSEVPLSPTSYTEVPF